MCLKISHYYCVVSFRNRSWKKPKRAGKSGGFPPRRTKVSSTRSYPLIELPASSNTGKSTRSTGRESKREILSGRALGNRYPTMEWALRDTVSRCFHRSRNVDEGVRSKHSPNFFPPIVRQITWTMTSPALRTATTNKPGKGGGGGGRNGYQPVW